MKLLIEVDITQPLLRGVTTKFNGVSRWLQFRYEKCQNFCYNCCVIGHGDKSCYQRCKDRNKELGQQYGEWLRIRGIKGGLITSKIKINHDYFCGLKDQVQKKNSNGCLGIEETEKSDENIEVTKQVVGEGSN